MKTGLAQSGDPVVEVEQLSLCCRPQNAERADDMKLPSLRFPATTQIVKDELIGFQFLR